MARKTAGKGFDGEDSNGTASEKLKRRTVTDDQPRVHFDCTKCPAFCCAIYERVAVTKRDINRLAKYFKVSVEEAVKRYTRLYEGEQVLRRKSDPLFGKACQFLDRKTRGCTVYHARPKVCREYPARRRCAYYDVLRFERKQQDDKDVLPLFQITFREWRPKQVEQKEEINNSQANEQVWEWTPEQKGR